MFCTSLGGEGKHSYLRLVNTGEVFCGSYGRNSYIRKLFCGRIDIYRAVTEYHNISVLVGSSLECHKEAAGNRLDTGLSLDYGKSCSEYVARRVDSARYHTVCVAFLYHHCAVVKILSDFFACVFGGHTFCLSELVKSVCIVLNIRSQRIDDFDIVKVGIGIHSLEFFLVTQKNNIGNLILNDSLSGFDRSGFLAFSQNYSFVEGLCFVDYAVDNFAHCTSSETLYFLRILTYNNLM